MTEIASYAFVWLFYNIFKFMLLYLYLLLCESAFGMFLGMALFYVWMWLQSLLGGIRFQQLSVCS